MVLGTFNKFAGLSVFTCAAYILLSAFVIVGDVALLLLLWLPFLTLLTCMLLFVYVVCLNYMALLA